MRERRRRRFSDYSRGSSSRQKPNDANSTSRDDWPSPPHSYQAAPPSSRIQTRLSDGGSSYLASLPPSPESKDSEDETEDLSDSSEVATTNFVRAISLSSLIHPTHDPRSQTTPETTQCLFVDLARSENLITQTCEALRVSVTDLQTLYVMCIHIPLKL